MSTQHDSTGTPYTTSGSGPAPSGGAVTIGTGSGAVAATMVGTVAVPNP